MLQTANHQCITNTASSSGPRLGGPAWGPPKTGTWATRSLSLPSCHSVRYIIAFALSWHYCAYRGPSRASMRPQDKVPRRAHQKRNPVLCLLHWSFIYTEAHNTARTLPKRRWTCSADECPRHSLILHSFALLLCTHTRPHILAAVNGTTPSEVSCTVLVKNWAGPPQDSLRPRKKSTDIAISVCVCVYDAGGDWDGQDGKGVAWACPKGKKQSPVHLVKPCKCEWLQHAHSTPTPLRWHQTHEANLARTTRTPWPGSVDSCLALCAASSGSLVLSPKHVCVWFRALQCPRLPTS